MRDAFNLNMLPIVPSDNMNEVAFNVNIRGITSTNGYYGYQPSVTIQQKEKCDNAQDDVDTACEMDIQFENLETNQQQQEQQQRVVTSNIPPVFVVNRKRAWEYCNEFREFKKRRQNDKLNLHFRKQNNEQFGAKYSSELLEELLKETHGCSIYHWSDSTNDL